MNELHLNIHTKKVYYTAGHSKHSLHSLSLHLFLKAGFNWSFKSHLYTYLSSQWSHIKCVCVHGMCFITSKSSNLGPVQDLLITTSRQSVLCFLCCYYCSDKLTFHILLKRPKTRKIYFLIYSTIKCRKSIHIWTQDP